MSDEDEMNRLYVKFRNKRIVTDQGSEFIVRTVLKHKGTAHMLIGDKYMAYADKCSIKK
jgi:hypothetical protein